MKFFKAFEQIGKPFITWHEWAKDIVELTEMGEFDNPLIVGEDYIPEYLYGVCPWKIEAGELVERTEIEMTSYEDDYIIETAKIDFFTKLLDVNSETFTYDGNEFMMDEVSRIYYQAIDKVRGNQKILTSVGSTYTLLDTATNIDDFLAAYYIKLHLTIKPAI